MKTRNLLFILSTLVVLLSACSTPAERVIKYTTNNNCKIEFTDGKFGEAKLVSNKYNKKG